MHEDDTQTQTHALTPERFARIRAIFEAALERKPAAREAYVDGACGADDLLRKEVLRMLAAEAQPDPLLDAPTTHPPSSAPEEGRFPAGTNLAGRYRILGMLGRGGMGEVYKAHDLILNQAVALKFLNPAHVSEAALIRFRNEVRIARQVSHPNVCRVYDLGMVEGLHFLSMEYIDDEDLASLLRRIGRLPQDKAIEFTRKICAGLGAAHERGVLHRDLKPANIMIDGRGQVRITDFGLAALAAEIPLSDIRSGTPAYMSPEQKAGKEVTTRSDIYSLGLVLHEMFTGKQRKAGTTTHPTEIVKDLDPAIERLILRCLEEEPKRRPAAPINVAMGLPGADPIAAALAAGETPSPEMVAASQEKEGFSPRTAILCFVGIVVSLLLGILWAENLGFLSNVPLPLSPDVLAYNAQQFLGKIGYTTPPADSAWALNCCDRSNEEALRKMDPARRKEVLASHQPAVIHFWYRQHLQAFPSGDGAYGRPTETSPPNSEPGMILVDLDATGRLLRLQVQPWTEQPTEAGVNWPALFEAAGLDLSRFTPVAPSGIPPMAVDAQLAWQGAYANHPEPVTIHAASWRGRPVLFEVQEPASSSDPLRAVVLFLMLPAALGMGILAWRNWRAGRWDRRGAALLTVATLAFALVAGRGTVSPILAFAVWILYVGIEPFARRYWPDSLISWTRVCQGQWNNSLVASHVLAALLPVTIVNFLVIGAFGLLSPLPLTNAYQNAFSQLSPWIKLPQGVAGGMGIALATNHLTHTD
ncbi:MAG: protein kinase [Bryobacteraceae bacterium]